MTIPLDLLRPYKEKKSSSFLGTESTFYITKLSTIAMHELKSPNFQNDSTRLRVLLIAYPFDNFLNNFKEYFNKNSQAELRFD